MTTGLTTTEFDQIIDRGVRTLYRSIGVDLVLGAGQDTTGGVTIRSLTGTIGRSMNNLRVSCGYGLGGTAMALARPVVVPDYLEAHGFVHAYDEAIEPEGIRSAFALPLQINDAIRGVLYLAQRSSVEFGSAVVGQALAFSRRLERDVLVEEAVRARLDEHHDWIVATPQEGGLSADTVRELRAEIEQMIPSVDGETRERLQAVSDRLSDAARTRTRPAHLTDLLPGSALSPREVDVLEAVARGMSNRATATALGLKPNTVKAYLQSASRKLGARNRVDAINRARAAGLL